MKRTVLLVLSTFCAVVSAFTVCVREMSNVSLQTASNRDDKFHVVVDAGHGGMDGGVTGARTGVKESDLNLAISYCLKDELEGAGFFVTMTRKTEFGLFEDGEAWSKKRDMQQRKKMIEESDPSLVISIHQNRYASSSVRGGQVFYKTGEEQGKAFALKVQESLNTLYKRQGANPRNATASNYYILDCSTAPSIIVECGFLSSPADESLLLTNRFQSEMAKSIFCGVMNYYSEIYGG